MSQAGRLYGVGVGPGDPELITLKARRVIEQADVVAYLAKRGGLGRARRTAAELIPAGKEELCLHYPLTTEPAGAEGRYRDLLERFYDEAAAQLAARLDQGLTVALLCEGDPFLYGSYIYLHRRLSNRYQTEVVPGICSFSAAAAQAGVPLASGDEVFAVVPATAPPDRLAAALELADAAALIKLGRNFAQARAALAAAERLHDALYVERATLAEGRVEPAAAVDPASVPYMSLLLAAQARRAPADNAPRAGGEVVVVGIGPGASGWITPEAKAALAGADHLVGYAPYLRRLQPLPGQTLHPSDNRQELERARQAIELAASGSRVAVVSSGDPGIFAMASALLEALEQEGAPVGVKVRVVPGISAMQAAAARVGAPLGHDFCVVSLSDNLKPWQAIEARLVAACRADLVLALYNPASPTRRAPLERAYALLLRERDPATPTVVARAVGSAEERVEVVRLDQLDLDRVDMRTLLIVGSSRTRAFEAGGAPLIYTPRSYQELAAAVDRDRSEQADQPTAR